MTLIYCPSASETARYLQAFQQALPEQQFVIEPVAAPDGVEQIICWGPPAQFFSRYRHLRAVFALGAGVDKLVARADLPASVAIVRLLDAGMAEQMLEYVLFGVLQYQRDMDRYQRQQQRGHWQAYPTRSAATVRVTVLGAGEIGGYVAKGLVARGYPVTTWSRQAHDREGIRSVAGLDALPDALAQTDVLVNLLPSTPATRQLLNAERLSALAPGAMLINAGRGDVLDDAALIAALDRGHLRCAMLDVFAEEPLPSTHPFWWHPGVLITPHVAAQTQLPEAVAQISRNLRALAAGTALTGVVERTRAY